MFADRPAVLEELLGCLFHIARADGRIADEEADYIANLPASGPRPSALTPPTLTRFSASPPTPATIRCGAHGVHWCARIIPTS